MTEVIKQLEQSICSVWEEVDMGKVEKMLDFAMSKLPDFDDDIGKLMDHLLSSKGGELSEEEWGLVNAALEEFVDSLEDEEEEDD